jgi:hypothetical protein
MVTRSTSSFGLVGTDWQQRIRAAEEAVRGQTINRANTPATTNWWKPSALSLRRR